MRLNSKWDQTPQQVRGLNTALQYRPISAIDALRMAVLALQQAKIETASLDARLLLQHVLGVSFEQWLAGDIVSLTPKQYADYQDVIDMRRCRKPLAQIIGKRQFWDHEFKVTSATLDPRPDSEALIEAVLEKIPNHDAPLRILDLGTGTGCLLLTLLGLFAKATGTGVDISEAALKVAAENAAKLQLQDRAHFMQSCWGEKVEGMFDIVISNPPYIPTKTIATLAPEVRNFEPMGALDGGEDGLDCYRDLMPQIKTLLAPQGIAVLEIGIGQESALKQLIAGSSLHHAGTKSDLGGIPRCVVIEKPAERN